MCSSLFEGFDCDCSRVSIMTVTLKASLRGHGVASLEYKRLEVRMEAIEVAVRHCEVTRLPSTML
jgi:hypothetical protein